MYIIQEVQTTGGQTILGVPQIKVDRQGAESAFYTLCAYAVISTVEEHAIVTYTHEGFPIPELTKCFKHAVQPAPAEVPVEEPTEETEDEPVEEIEESEEAEDESTEESVDNPMNESSEESEEEPAE